MIVFKEPATSNISGFLIKTPLDALLPVATAMAAGVAKPKAQGQDMTSTHKAKFKLNSISLDIIIHTIKVNKDIDITPKTKYLDILSANLSIGIFSVVAFFCKINNI